ncbi:hypothetical protein AB0E63_41810 [Kribbella sp. NPDC026596]|uniref:hypothetical protein n=1 Tax=Kribbella sp. NPDC026596 TaxID=3155122 RepID=UPI0033F85796
MRTVISDRQGWSTVQRWDPINERQREVLVRIAAGEDLSGDANIPSRTSAGALRNRGLITIHRHAGRWDADITEVGKFYLANGHHPDDPRHAQDTTRPTTPIHRHTQSSGQAASPTPPAQTKPASATVTDRRRSAADELAKRLAAEGSIRVNVATEADKTHWRRVIDFAKRHNLPPAGTRIEKTQLHPDALQIRLLSGPHPNAGDATSELPPIPVPDRLRSPHPAVADLKTDKNRLMMPAPLRHRSLVILQALAAELTKRGHEVRRSPVPERHIHGGYHLGPQYLEPSYARRDGVIEVVIGENRYPITISQESPNSADPEKADRLLVDLGWGRRQHKWADRKRSTVEHRLAEICHELETRAAEDDVRRAEAAQAKEERRRLWTAAMELANDQAITAHRSQVLIGEVQRWRLATEIRQYCDALERNVDPADESATWIAWARSHADAIDPLISPPAFPIDPDLKPEDLKPHLGRWSPYGPDGDARDWLHR